MRTISLFVSSSGENAYDIGVCIKLRLKCLKYRYLYQALVKTLTLYRFLYQALVKMLTISLFVSSSGENAYDIAVSMKLW